MFERFTERSKRVLVLARQEAGILNHTYIGPEHLLLGLISEGEGVAARALEAAGIGLEAARRQVVEIVDVGREATPSHIPLTSLAKRVLELSIQEALQLGHDYVGTEHLLLGLMSAGESVALQVLVRLGADPSRVRQLVLSALAQPSPVSAAVPGQSVRTTPKVASALPEQNRAEYANLDLAIRRVRGESFAVRVVNSPAGQTAEVPFLLPWSEEQLDTFLLEIGRQSRSIRQIDRPESVVVKDFGSGLYQSLFKGHIEAILMRSISEAVARGRGLRIRLRLTEAPTLAAVPWEFLYDAVRDRFLCLSERTPIVRSADDPDPAPVRPLDVSRPLKILVAISSPSDPGLAQLDTEREWERISTVLAPLVEQNAVQVQCLPRATPGDLLRALRRDEWNILHFVGHCGFDPSIRDGILVFEDERHRSRIVSAQDLAVILHDHDPLRLVVLNDRKGATTDEDEPFFATAQALMRQGTAAIVAAQFEISDQTAMTFASEMYGAISDGYPLEVAVAAARKAIFIDGNQTGWATPVIYLGADSGFIFNVQSH